MPSTEKLAVMICMDKYVELDGQYMPVTINMSKHNGQFEEYRCIHIYRYISRWKSIREIKSAQISTYAAFAKIKTV